MTDDIQLHEGPRGGRRHAQGSRTTAAVLHPGELEDTVIPLVEIRGTAEVLDD